MNSRDIPDESGALKLSDIMDAEEMQSLLESFHGVTGMCVGIVDVEGHVLASAGWRDICAKFHRTHPEAERHCMVSDAQLSEGVKSGEYRLYRCGNNMLDFGSPIIIADQHLGSTVFGQFFYDDEVVDVELFRKQARQYGFDEDEYIAALDRIPRYGREKVEHAMQFCTKLAGMISALGYSNLQLSKALGDRKLAERTLRQKEERNSILLENAPYMISIVDNNANFMYANEVSEQVLGYSVDYLKGTSVFDYAHPDDLQKLRETVLEVQTTGFCELDYRFRTQAGPYIDIHSKAVTIKGTNQFYVYSEDVTEKKRAEEELKQNEARLIVAQSIANIGDFTWDFDTGDVTWSQGLYDLLGYDKSQPLDFSKVNTEIHHPEDLDRITRWLDECIKSGLSTLFSNEYRLIRKDGVVLDVQATVSVKHRDGKPFRMIGTIQDITHELQLEAQLRQGQKMEAVGRLAGGVAHDFNNMLSVIIGHVDMALDDAELSWRLHTRLDEVKKAAQRSADLTSQLLAFARRQTVAPKVIDLNETVTGMIGMLERLIGEDIDVVWVSGDKVWPLKIDPGQIDQILVNLCVNARDAIADVGKVTIETSNVVVDEGYCIEHQGAVPGEYVMLAVSDNGCGMNPETLDNIFEPFYTTKETGKGTGLGLATVYGVVKQNQGYVEVCSEPGRGALFKVYLPRYSVDEVVSPDVPSPVQTACGNETILLVEDQPSVLHVAKMMLESGGYSVLAAESTGEAIRLAREHAGDISLLMTDVIMPDMNGRDLARDLLSLYPDLACLFMSGYTANVIAQHGVLSEDVYFIQKPFSKRDLLAKVQEILTKS